MRFLVDMNLATEVAVRLRAQGHDAVHLRELGLQELRDEAVLAKAVAERRVVVTFDLDFADIAAAAGETRAAVILLRLRSAQTARLVDRLRNVLASTRGWLPRATSVVALERRAALGDWRNRYRRRAAPGRPWWLDQEPGARLRIRRLPIGR
jgi:predicted nuclease of predicted toxin-antitoxin system